MNLHRPARKIHEPGSDGLNISDNIHNPYHLFVVHLYKEIKQQISVQIQLIQMGEEPNRGFDRVRRQRYLRPVKELQERKC